MEKKNKHESTFRKIATGPSESEALESILF